MAALLHDIGKFWQRASHKIGSKDDNLSDNTKQLQADYCPEFNGKRSHLHVLWTSEFIEKHASHFSRTIEWEGRQFQLASLAARHHKRDLTGPEAIIAFADKLSSGQDRRAKTEAELAEIEQNQPDSFKKIRLQSIFDNLFQSTAIDSAVRKFHHLVPLSLSKSVFAQADLEQDEKMADEYKTLWSQFLSQVSKLPKGNPGALCTSLLSLLKTYTWCIPSSTQEQPDVSLFDHLKTTAAIAVSLFDSIKDHGEIASTFEGLIEEDKKRFSIIAGDFSGIQNFIYQINSKAAAKTLKGRSFFLQLMLDSILARLKEIYAVQDAHILFASGGRFYMLVANDKDNWQKAEQLFEDVNKQLLADYDGVLYLVAGKLDFAPKVLLEKDSKDGRNVGYPALVEDVQSVLEAVKKHKFSNVIAEDDSFFNPQPLKGLTENDVCSVTGMDLYPEEPEFKNKTNRQLFFSDTWKKEDGPISKTAYEQIRLGSKLRGAKYIIRCGSNPVDQKDTFDPLGLGYAYRIVSKGELEDAKRKDYLRNADLIITLNDPTGFLDEVNDLDSTGRTFWYYGASWVPRDAKGDILEFEDIASATPSHARDSRAGQELEKDKTKGNPFNALGIVRMDVDNLGKAFKEGFIRINNGKKENLGTISRVTTLSSQLDWFFSGYLHSLLSGGFTPEESDPVLPPAYENDGYNYGRHLYPVYAGGDDVFLIARWDIAPIIAKHIYRDFRSFTNANPKTTISGGISIIQPKAPIHKGAEDAGEQESKAKKLVPIGTKDAISFLQHQMNWHDLDLASELVFEFKELVKKMNSRGVIGLLRDTSVDYLHLKHLDESRALYGRWRWRAAYQLARMQKQYKECDVELGPNGLGGEMFMTGTVRTRRPNRVQIPGFKLKTGDDNTLPEQDIIELMPLVTRWLTTLIRT